MFSSGSPLLCWLWASVCWCSFMATSHDDATDNTVEARTRAVAGRSLHGLGVICGLAAGVWLGAAEAPTKLVNAGFSPFAVSLCMVAGVFTARWTFPTLLKGTGYVFA